MKPWIKILIGAAVAWTAALSAHAQVTPTAVSASPSSAKPGDQVTFTVRASNTATTNFSSPTDFTVLLTNLVTGATFTATKTGVRPKGGFIPAATVDPVTNANTPGVGTFEFSGTIPTQTTQAGGYRATVTMGSASVETSTAVLTVVGKPDFIITSLTYPAGVSYKGGDAIPMTLTFRNLSASGGVNNVPWVPPSSSAYFRIEVVLSTNPKFGDADDFLLTFLDVKATGTTRFGYPLASLAGNGGATVLNADDIDRTISWNQLLPGNYAGSYYVLAKIDTLAQVDETTPDDDFNARDNNWYDTNAPRLALQPTSYPTIYMASRTPGGTSSNSYSDNPAVSADGRYTAFVSDSTDLVVGDTNGVRDVFIFDNQTSLVRRINISQQGAQANAGSANPAISGDGRYVAFASDATNLVFGDTNGFTDIFVVDTVTGAVSRESVGSSGVQANGSSFRPALSSDGRYVVFESNATNLASPGGTGVTQIYLRDRVAGTTTLVSQNSGVPGSAASVQAAISGDGRLVAFASDASNLVAGDTNGVRDVFLRDVNAGTTTRISVDSSGGEANGASRAPSINRNPGNASDGRYIAFSSEATNLVAGDTNGVSDVFVRDRVAGTTTRVSVSTTGAQATDPTDATTTGSHLGSLNPSISATGRYVAFASLANNLTPGDFAGRYAASDSNDALDVFVMDRDVNGSGTFDTPGNIATSMVSVNRFGYQTIWILGIPSTPSSDIYPVISGDGRWVAFPSDGDGPQGLVHGATNRVSPDGNRFRDVFVHDRRINALPNPATLPTVTVSSPVTGSTYPVNSKVDLVANASTQIGSIASVQFFANGTSLGAPDTTFPYSATWTPVAMGNYVLSALVTDSFGNQSVSNNVNVTISAISPTPPTVAITGPSPTASLYVGSPFTVIANAADADGTVASVQFFANGNSIGTDTTSPFSVSFTPTATGTYSLTAVAMDNGGNLTTSAPVVVTVANPEPPTVAITSPANGSGVAINTPQNLHANAASANGTIVSVQFFANGSPIGAVSSAPFDVQWTPTTAGAYQLTAVATDNIGTQTTSAPVTVLVAASGGGDVIFSGTYQGTNESGRFAFINVRGKFGTFIAYSTSPVGRTYFFPALSVESGGGFSSTDSAGVVGISGMTSATGVSGSFDGGRLMFIGPVIPGSTNNVVPAGYYGGGLANRPGGALTAIVGGDGGITIYATDGASFRDAGAGQVTGSGSFSVVTPSGNRFAGAIDPATGYLSGTMTGGPAGAFTAALQSGVSFSDGFLRNLSTRGQVGTGANIMIAGFVVGGTANKQVLIRAIGPSLAGFGVSGSLADPVLDLFDAKNTRVASNDNWGGVQAIVTATGQAGAFPLDAGSRDSVLLTTLAPGAYTAQVSGVGGAAGVALVELYDMDSLAPFSSQKILNVATRGVVGTGQAQLIAGFVVTGNTAKKVLIRAVGPTLGAAPFNVPGVLADPVLRLVQTKGGTSTVVRENDNWEAGNDPALLADAVARVKAFSLPSGSKDAAILISLSPGVYTAQVTGTGTTTGVALVEVYEVP